MYFVSLSSSELDIELKVLQMLCMAEHLQSTFLQHVKYQRPGTGFNEFKLGLETVQPRILNR